MLRELMGFTRTGFRRMRFSSLEPWRGACVLFVAPFAFSFCLLFQVWVHEEVNFVPIFTKELVILWASFHLGFKMAT